MSEVEEWREIGELGYACRKMVEVVERGERTDVPEKALELAEFIAESSQRMRDVIWRGRQAVRDSEMTQEEAHAYFSEHGDMELEAVRRAAEELVELMEQKKAMR